VTELAFQKTEPRALGPRLLSFLCSCSTPTVLAVAAAVRVRHLAVVQAEVQQVPAEVRAASQPGEAVRLAAAQELVAAAEPAPPVRRVLGRQQDPGVVQRFREAAEPCPESEAATGCHSGLAAPGYQQRGEQAVFHLAASRRVPREAALVPAGGLLRDLRHQRDRRPRDFALEQAAEVAVAEGQVYRQASEQRPQPALA